MLRGDAGRLDDRASGDAASTSGADVFATEGVGMLGWVFRSSALLPTGSATPAAKRP
jgi:hypothetical protein